LPFLRMLFILSVFIFIVFIRFSCKALCIAFLYKMCYINKV
jgi:hypothetical protein